VDLAAKNVTVRENVTVRVHELAVRPDNLTGRTRIYVVDRRFFEFGGLDLDFDRIRFLVAFFVTGGVVIFLTLLHDPPLFLLLTPVALGSTLEATPHLDPREKGGPKARPKSHRG
jgi:hypothetical protein